MAFNRKNNRREAPIEKKVSCSCGSSAKLSSRKNYPFGRGSKGRTSKFYKCGKCYKVTFLNKDSGGKR